MLSHRLGRYPQLCDLEVIMVKSVVGMDYQHVGRTVAVSDKILHSNMHEMTSFVYHTNALIRAFNVISSETGDSDIKIHNCVSVSINISFSGPLKFDTV